MTELEGWDDADWGWKDEDEPEAESKSTSLSWLQECHVSLSPAGELMVLANGDRLVLLARTYFGVILPSGHFKFCSVTDKIEC